MNCPHRPSTVGELTPNREQSSSLELPRCEGGRPTGQTNYFECTCPKECPRHGSCCACVAHHRKMGNLPHCLREQEGK